MWWMGLEMTERAMVGLEGEGRRGAAGRVGAGEDEMQPIPLSGTFREAGQLPRHCSRRLRSLCSSSSAAAAMLLLLLLTADRHDR
jgi:hypothetical protein